MLDVLATARAADETGTPRNMAVALAAVRKHLGMEVAYISEFVDGRSVFRSVDAPGLEALIKAGDSYSLDDVYCRHILAGRLPELMADTADHALAQSIPITKAVPIGAHMSVPLRLPDGSAYGMFCCLSPHPNRSLNDRDLQIMRVFAEVAAHQISHELEAERALQTSRDRIEQVIEQELFTVLYQPIFRFEPFELRGFEALCRFSAQPYRSPDVWFKEADAAGLGVRLELAVLKKALQALSALPENIFVSVNASPETIVSGQLDTLLEPCPKGRVVLEITEHAEVKDYDALLAAMLPLRKSGIRLAIDDAGAGYSSFQHIIRLNPDIIKLDMSLTRAVDMDLGRQALASALSFFARSTGSEIVAEGIESESEFATLRTLGVTKGQGYLLGRPAELQVARALAAQAQSAPPPA